MKSLQEYIDKKRKFQEAVINFIENETRNGNESSIDLKDLIEKLNEEQILQDRQEMESFLYMVSSISKYHHRSDFFFTKIENLLLECKKEIRHFFTDKELFHIFQSNKRILLFLIKQKMLVLDQSIVDIMLIKYEKFNYIKFFLPDIKKFLNNEQIKLNEIDETNFEENRKIGENDNYICKLIRNDLIDEFINYVNSKNIQLSTTIENSIYETNPLLNKKNPTLIEYSAFFGSIQIFKYLLLNKVEITESLLIYSIHGCNSELIHLLEENLNQISNYLYSKSISESIKCHHNDLADYFINNNQNNNEIVLYDGIKYYNYFYLPVDLGSLESFYFFCKYNYFKIVEFIIKENDIDINFVVIRLYLF